MHDWIVNVKDEIFKDSADTLMERLAGAAQTVGNTLTNALEQLAEKVTCCSSVVFLSLTPSLLFFNRLRFLCPFCGKRVVTTRRKSR
jgi:hypothetical protein